MPANNSSQSTLRHLTRLYRLMTAGEKGFRTVAEGVRNRGLKVLLKNYAHKRKQFAQALLAQIKELGGNKPRESIIGMIHRGRIAIKTALVVGPQSREKTVLGEALFGEKIALRAYKYSLNQDMPAPITHLLEEQYDHIQATRQNLARLYGKGDKQTVVRLLDTPANEVAIVDALEAEGFSPNKIETEDFSHALNLYQGAAPATTIKETVLAGVIGGLIFGSATATLAGVALTLLINIATTTIAALILAGTTLGLILGLILGFFIGLGISEEDEYLSDDSRQHGHTLIRLHTTPQRASQAAKTMYEINAMAKAQTQ
ncbi:MAG TPA: PA2169 family four-helix-bundle protein [Anaerolineae bacterium]|nr:PA2169 family four-helix-bundle protein [Anaerolineae bacterium]